MGKFCTAFWEIPADTAFLENIPPSDRSPWYETSEDRERRYAFREFFNEVFPIIRSLIDAELTARQREILHLYYFQNMRQEEIANILRISQSTISRHLFGTVRNGKRIGGAIPKLQRAVTRLENGPLRRPFRQLARRLRLAGQ